MSSEFSRAAIANSLTTIHLKIVTTAQLTHIKTGHDEKVAQAVMLFVVR